MKVSLTADELRKMLSYDAESGVFIWKYRSTNPKNWNTKWGGKVAGYVSIKGHIVININKKLYYAHRLAWLYMTGEWPVDQIDHANLIKTDNRFANLREADTRKNAQNRPINRTNTSGFKSVYWHTAMRKWHAEIKKDRVKYHLGWFDSPELAHAAYAAKAIELFGKFARIA